MPSDNHTPSPLQLQQALVLPALDANNLSLPSVLTTLDQLNTPRLLALLRQHALSPLWFESTIRADSSPADFTNLSNQLRPDRIASIATAAQQLQLATTIQIQLEEIGCRSVIFKGIHLGQVIYPELGLRPSADIDILIPHGSKARAVTEMLGQNAVFKPAANTVGYQSAFLLDRLEVDLHWRMLRQGRSQTEIAPLLLENPTDLNGLKVPNDSATLLTMLVQPLLSTRPGAADAKLVRLIDLALWLRHYRPDSESIADMLHQTQTQHVAWLMLEWLARITGESLLKLPSSLTPSPRKQRWLGHWLPDNKSSAILNSPLPVQFGYRTALHTSMKGTLNELGLLAKSKLFANRELHAFKRLLNSVEKKPLAE